MSERGEGDRISFPGSKLVVVSRAARTGDEANEREIGGDASNFVRLHSKEEEDRSGKNIVYSSKWMRGNREEEGNYFCPKVR